MKALQVIVIVGGLVAASQADAGPVVYQATGANAAAIQATVTSFRSALGDPNNANTAGSQAAGRREINWDGGGAAANVGIFPNPMTTFSARGAVFTTPGTALEQSAAGGGTDPADFAEINPTYAGLFAPFSSPRMFSALNSNIVDVHFFVPGSTTVRAATTGFGAVFTDVDSATSTKMEFFSPDDVLLWEGFVPATPGSESLSFLGATFTAGEVVGWVRITSGNAALGPDETGSIDLVVMDDFIYGEPVSTTTLTISPFSGHFFKTAAIDMVVAYDAGAATVVNGRVKLDGADVTGAFVQCIVPGTIVGGGQTLRCSLPRNVFTAGEHVLAVELDLSNATRLRNAVKWTIVNNTEP